MAQKPRVPARPALDTAPFGSANSRKVQKVTKAMPNKMLPGPKALKELAFGNPAQKGILNFGRLTPIGSGIKKRGSF